MATIADTVTAKCFICDGDRIAIWSCIQCNNKMCDQCKNDHLKSKQSCNHSVFTISGKDKADVQSNQDPEICELHPSNKLSNYCKTCDNIVCSKCISESHHAHPITNVCDVAKDKRKDLLKYITKLKETLMSNSSINQRLNNKEKDYIAEMSNAIEDIRKRGDELKSEIDYITSIFVEKLRTAGEENLRPIRNKIKELDEQIKDLKQVIEQREEDYRSLSDLLILKISKDTFKDYISYPSEPLTLRDPPKFKTGTKDDDTLLTLFGDIDTESDLEKGSDCIDTEISHCPNIDSTIISSFKMGRPSSCISCLSDDKSWVGYRSNSKEIVLAAKDGLLIKTITFDCCPKDVAATPKAELIISDNEGKTLRRISRGGKVLNVFSTAPFEPQGVFATEDDLFVCLYKYGEPGKISRFTFNGTHVASIQYDKKKSALFLNPCFVAQNTINGDLCVIDRNEILVVVNQHCELRFRYGEQRSMKLKCFGLTCDNYANVLLSDQNTNSVIVINKHGEYVQSIERNISHPWGICVAKTGHLWICNSGGHILIVKYLA